jgi:branched-chain amino acid transport system permease protein
MGYGGLVSLGTAGFMGVGAYLTAILTVDVGLPFFLVLLITVAVTVLLGIIVGLVSLRVEGFFLAIATLVLSEILRRVFMQLEIFNGFAGRSIPNFPTIFGHTLNRNETYWLLVIFLVLAMMITYNIFKSPTGRAMSAMRGSEPAARAMGINIFRYRLLTFAVATGFAGLAGSLFMYFMRFTNPHQWILILSLQIFAVVVIGGVRSVAGTVLGAFIVFGTPDLIFSNLPVIGDVHGLAFVFTGVLIVVVVLFSPLGLIYLWYNLWYKFKAFVRKIFRKKRGEAT